MKSELEQHRRAVLAAGEAAAWQEFIGTAIPQLYRMFVSHWANPALAEELVQKTIFDAVRGFASYDTSKGGLEEWIFGIGRNNLALEARRRASRPTADGDIAGYLERIDTEPLPDEVLERKEMAGIVRAAMEKLESKERSALKLKYIEALPASQIAGQMGISERAVHSLLYRARISLRKELKQLAPLNKGGRKHERK